MLAQQTYVIFVDVSDKRTEEIEALEQIVSLVSAYVSKHKMEQSPAENPWMTALNNIPFLTHSAKGSNTYRTKNLNAAIHTVANVSEDNLRDAILTLGTKFSKYLKESSNDILQASYILLEAFTNAAQRVMVNAPSIRLTSISFSSEYALNKKYSTQDVTLQITAYDYSFDFNELMDPKNKMDWDALMKGTGAFPGVDRVIRIPE
jgi:hypothetical protein